VQRAASSSRGEPAQHAALKELERLFEREPRGMRLSTAGQRLLGKAKTIPEMVDGLSC
jgi:DNA-binding transcriptional LysR family regulator